MNILGPKQPARLKLGSIIAPLEDIKTQLMDLVDQNGEDIKMNEDDIIVLQDTNKNLAAEADKAIKVQDNINKLLG